jgi:hypothetical protein
VSGKYYIDCEQRELQAKYCDKAIQKKVWDDSKKIVGLSEDDLSI